MISLHTNNMGYWCLSVGNKSDVLALDPDAAEMFYGELKIDEPLYLAFMGELPDHGGCSTMAITNLDTLKKRLISDAKRDWRHMLDTSNEVKKTASDGLLNIMLQKNNHTLESVELSKNGALFVREDFGKTACDLFTHAGNNLSGLGYNDDNVFKFH